MRAAAVLPTRFVAIQPEGEETPPLARQAQSTELLTVGQAAAQDGDDGLRRLVEREVPQVLEAALTSFLAADPYERTGERQGYRNGDKPRLLKTRVGERELLGPEDRDGAFQTELFERYQRSEKALLLAIAQMYVEGVSTRKVAAITEALCGLEISKSQVSARSRAWTRNSPAGASGRWKRTTRT